MFDTLVVPILLYCSDVWGVYNHKDIDNLHLKYCKTILGVRPQTLSVICKERTLKFWLKSMHNQDPPLYKVFIDQCASNEPNCWALTVNKLLCDLGFSNTLTPTPNATRL